MALTQTEVSELYVSIFGRASEGSGNAYWMSDPASTDMVTTANVMLATSDAIAYFGDTLDSNSDFIEFIYANTLGKTATEDPDGIAYWVAELDGGKTKGQVVAAMITAAQATENAGDAQDQFNNRVTVSNHTADTLEDFTTRAEFAGFIDGVDETEASVTAATAAVDLADPDAGGDAGDILGSTYQLTDSSVGDGSADNVLGTAGDDTISGATGTLESIDVIDGAGGDDVLTARVAATGIAPVISNVETIDFLTRGTASVNFADITGYNTVSISGTNDFAATALPNDFVATLKDLDGETVTLSLDSVTGTADAMTVNLDGVTPGATLVLGQDLETLNLVSGGDAKNEMHLDLNVGAALTVTGATFDVVNGKIVVTGDQDLELDFQDSAVNFSGPNTDGSLDLLNLDASGLTGVMTVAAEDASTNDVRNFTGVDVYEFYTLNGGAYAMDNAEDDAAISAIAITAIPGLTIDYDQDGAEKISSKTDSVGVSWATIDSTDDAAFTLGLTTNKIETIALTATGATDADSTLAITFTDANVQNLTLDGDSLAVVDSLALTGTAFTGGKLVNVDAGSETTADTSFAVVSSAPSSTPISITTGAGDDVVSINSTGNADVSFETNGGDDQITVVGGTGDVEVEAGSGDDTITGGAGDDSIDVGTGGTDTVVFAATAALNGADTIQSFTSLTDVIDMTAATITGAAAGTIADTTDTLLYYFTSAVAGDADSIGAVAAKATLDGTFTAASGVVAFILMTDDDSSSIWQWTDAAAADEVNATELVLMGTIDDAIVFGDITI